MTALAAILTLALSAAPPTAPVDAPTAPAGAQAAPLPGDDAASGWRLALSTGVAGRFGGREISPPDANHGFLLFFGGQADGSWPESHGQAARLRFRLFTGGESDIYVPSDGEVEVAYMLGLPVFRFVLARAEVARQPGVGLQVLAQAGTLPCFEGTVSLAGDAVHLTYFVSPVEAAWVRYQGRAHLTHLPGWTTEDDRPSAASAGRLRWTTLLPAWFSASVQGDVVKLWGKADLLVAVEGDLAYQVPRQQVSFQVGARWTSYTRRGLAKDTRETDGEVVLVGSATLAL